ncbi:tripartite tricarboxylate transporter TctB family protein [Ferdinandcohnia sp. SAFN-114]|uniref:tripartite tricarboxylate transporter TctB family protein n=1 Tax=Ferdinandcohnia sp. SAFN-114 TaxID=3387275 RepID=UPI003F7EA051
MANNRLVSIGLLLFCGLFYYQSTLIESKELSGLPATFFPRLILGIIAFLSVIMLIKSFFVPTKVTQKSDSTEGKSKKEWIVWVLFGLFAVYLVLIDVVGFITSSFLYMATVYLLIVQQKKSWKKHLVAIGGLLAITLGITLFFQGVLHVYLPKGLFF